MYDTVTLIEQSFTGDEYGNQTAEDIKTGIFAEVEDVSSSEFHNAGQNGLKPAYKFVVWSWEYNGEKLISYRGKLYTVYRTYTRADKTELYLEERTGVVNGGS